MRALLLLLCSCGRISFDHMTSGDGGESDAVDGARLVTPRIRSVQRSSHAMGISPLPVSITAVDPAKTLVMCDYRTTDSAAGRKPMCELTDATTVTLSAGVPDAAVTATLQVIEFTDGARVQRGLASLTPTTELVRDVPIAPVQLDRAFAVISRRTDLQFNNGDSHTTVMAELVSPTLLRLSRRSAASASLDVAWQVIELDGASVQAGRLLLDVSQTVINQPLPRQVDPITTFVVTNHQVTSDIEGEYLVRTERTADRLVHVRNLAAVSQVDVAWFAITIPGSRVQHGTAPMAALPALTTPLAAIDDARSFSVTSVSGGTGANNDLDGSAVTSEITDGTTLMHQRGMPDMANVSVSWFVVEWPL